MHDSLEDEDLRPDFAHAFRSDLPALPVDDFLASAFQARSLPCEVDESAQLGLRLALRRKVQEESRCLWHVLCQHFFQYSLAKCSPSEQVQRVGQADAAAGQRQHAEMVVDREASAWFDGTGSPCLDEFPARGSRAHLLALSLGRSACRFGPRREHHARHRRPDRRSPRLREASAAGGSPLKR